jgi:hypothetical protein
LGSKAQSVTTKQAVPALYHDIYVYCDGVLADIINGPIYFHLVDHWNPVTGKKTWWKFVLKSDELVSSITGEVFSGMYYERGEHNPENDLFVDVMNMHLNLRGDQGSQYVLSITLNPPGEPPIINKAICK